MRQVLFTIPVFGGIKIFGYGLMLFLAFLGSMNLAAWRARREKLDPEVIYDLALWVFLGGLIGARLFYVDPVLGRSGPHVCGHLQDLGGGDRPLREHHRRDGRVLPLPAAPPVPAPAVARRDRPGAGAGDRDRPARLLPQRLLLRRRLPPPLGGLVPRAVAPLATHQVAAT